MRNKIVHLAFIVAVLISLLYPSAPAYAGEEYVFQRSWPEEPGPGVKIPADVAVDSFGNIYVANIYNHRILKLAPSGEVLLSWGTKGSRDGQFYEPSGIAVDSSGFVYVADTWNSRIQKFTSDGDFAIEWGTWGDGDGHFAGPKGVAVDGWGNVYVADTENSRIQVFTSDGEFLTKWGVYGDGPGQFYYPSGIAVDSLTGVVYVADGDNHRIQVFTSDGVFLDEWRIWWTDEGQYWSPADIAVVSLVDSLGVVYGVVYVADNYFDSIQMFTLDGIFLGESGGYGQRDGEFANPAGIAVDDLGYVYVADTDNNRIQKFTPDGIFLTKWGPESSDDGRFYWPFGIAVDSSGDVYVADTYNHRVQKFTPDGVFLTKWGTWGDDDGQFDDPSGIAVDGSGNVYVADAYNSRIQKFASDGKFLTKWGAWGDGDGQFSWPRGVAVDSSGFVYVADTGNHRIQKFTSDGKFLTKWGTWGDGDRQFYAPNDVAVDGSGNVYVADTYNSRIQKFTSNGKFLTGWGIEADGDGQFSWPHGVAVDGLGNVYVADTMSARIQKFTSDGKFMTKWGVWGFDDGQFLLHRGIAVDGQGNVYVVDSGNHRIQKFAPVFPLPIADFSADPTSGASPLTVSFTDLSQNDPTSWRWDFGDGGTSDLQSPTHTYTEPGGYTVTLRVANPAGSNTKTKEDYIQVEPPPSLALYVKSVDFEIANTEDSFTISNAGGGTLSWNVTPDLPGWLTASPMSGETSSGGTSSVSLNVTRQGLSPGPYTHIISITSSGGTGSVSVTMTVSEPSPVLSLSTTSLDFGTAITESSLTISNTGGGTLSWDVTPDLPGWLTASPMSGETSSGRTSSVSLNVTRQGLSPRAYTHTVSITSNGGNGSVSVTMTVPEPVPSLSVSPALLDFGTIATEDSFTITNTGGGTLSWQIASQQPGWLSLSSTSGSIQSGNESKADATVSRSGLDPGSYEHTISITSNGGSGSVSVTMTVSEPSPSLSSSPTSLDFGTTVAGGSFTITNAGGGTLTWQVASQQPGWLSLSPTSGSIQSGNGSKVDATVNRSGLSSGSYNHTISITSNGGSGSVSVAMTVPEPLVQPPTGLTAQGKTGTVELSWNVSSDISVIGYNIYRGLQRDEVGSKINPVLVTAVIYQDKPPERDSTYWYKVTAVNARGEESAKSEAAQIFVPGPDFEITCSQPTQSVQAGEAVTSVISLEGKHGFDSIVDLSVKGLPDGITSSFDPDQLSSAGETSNLTLDVSLGVSRGKYEFEVLGISEDKVRRTKLTLEITERERKVSAITVDAPDEVQWNSKVPISGKIFDPKNASVKFGNIQVSLTFTPPAVVRALPAYAGTRVPVLEKTAITDSSGKYHFSFSDLSPESMGNWKVKAAWPGDDTYEDAEIEDEFEVTKVVPEVTWSGENPEHLEITGEESVSISGSIKYDLDHNPGVVEVVLSITNPDGSSDSEKAGTSNLGTFTFAQNVDKSGYWKFVVFWGGNDIYNEASSDEYILRVEEAIGKAVIIQGHGNDSMESGRFSSVADYTYDVFTRRKFTDADIYYLSSEHGIGGITDAVTSLDNVQYAITTWALTKLNPKLSLYIYIVGHNGSNGFLIDKGKFLTGEALDGWLDQLADKYKDITIVIEACYSGAFINELSADGRTIITSSQASSKSFLLPNYSFTKFFFDRIVEKRNIKESFELASEYVQADKLFRDQTPQLEATGDRSPNDNIDKVKVEDKYIDGDYESIIPESFPPEIVKKSEDKYLSEGANETSIWAQVFSAGKVKRVWAVVVPPGYRESEPKDEYTTPGADLPEVELKPAGANKYEGKLEGLNKGGTYILYIYAEDEYGTSQPKVILVTVSGSVVEPGHKLAVSWGDVKDTGSAGASPSRFALGQNYPNPFNPETWIPYQLAKDDDVVIRIYDSTGRLIRRLDLGYKPAGYYLDKDGAAYWDGKNSWGERAANGVYFYQFAAGDFTAVRKLAIIE